MGISLTTFSARARSFFVTAVATICLALFGPGYLNAMTDLYQLSQTTGSPTDMTGSTQIYAANASYASSTSTYPIGFTFYFDNQPYTTFSPNPGGAMSLGRATYASYQCYYWPNYSTLSSYYPMITASWCYAGGPVSNGKVHYKLTGTAPNRVLTVEWLNIHTVSSTSYTGGTWQVRLYEGSNTIEFWYGSFTYTSTYYFNVGIASSTTRYINIWGNNITQYYLYPSGQYYTYRYPSSYPINANTIFEFAPCNRNIDGLIGNTAEGGTPAMKSGADELLVGKEVQRGNTGAFHPFSIDLPASPCGQWTYTTSFSGPAAGDYSVSPGNGTVITDGLAPTLNFTPNGTGVRDAVMTLRISNGEVLTYALKAIGRTRIQRIGNIPEGGTLAMNNGDKLMADINVPRNESQDFRPFSITNINTAPTNPGIANAQATFTLDDPYNQYAIRLESAGSDFKGGSLLSTSVVSASLAPGASLTPVITFAPNSQGVDRGTGPQPATLTMSVDGETFTYPICAFAIAPLLRMSIDGEPVTESGARLFVSAVECVGEGASDHKLVLENPGRTPVVIESLDVLQTESEVRQGTPPYPLLLDRGNLIPMNDYFISENPAVAPTSANQLIELPMVIQPGETRTLYLGFAAQRPAKRYGRMFMRTDAVNFVGIGIDGYLPDASKTEETEGVMVFDFFGRGLSSGLAGSPDGTLDDLPMLFDPVKVLQTGLSETRIYNTGDCDLRISRGDLRLVAGDVSDFRLMEILPNTSVDGKGDFIIPPGGSDKITAMFKPSRSGSRRASVLLKTNDSTVVIDGVTDRGTHYLDLYGVGKADLEIPSIVLPPAVIDGPVSSGVVTAYNASTEAIRIMSARLTGPDIAEITSDPSNWPSLPVTIAPGEELRFGVIFRPGGGSTSGPRSAALELTLQNTDVVTADIGGIAGTRTIIANPATLFNREPVPVGSLAREYAVISNIGTFPVRITGIGVTGDNPDDYSLNIPANLSLDPGASIFIEATYRPTAPGASSARIEILNNGTAGTQYIELGGTASRALIPSDPPDGRSMLIGQGDDLARSVISRGSMTVRVLPNPVREKGTVSFNLPSRGSAEIDLYDLTGNRVGTIYSGGEELEGRVALDVDGLATGTYYIVLKQAGNVARSLVRVVR